MYAGIHTLQDWLGIFKVQHSHFSSPRGEYKGSNLLKLKLKESQMVAPAYL